MTIKKSQLGLEVLLSALVLGIAGEVLLFQTGWGLGATCWVVGVMCGGFLLINRWEALPDRFEQWLLAPMVLLALFYGWRDAGMLKFANTIGLISLLGLSIQTRQMKRILPASERIPGIISSSVVSLIGFPVFVSKEVKWDALSSGIDRQTIKSVGRGLLLGVPCLFVFGVLLSSADKDFAALMGSFFDVDVVTLPVRILVVAVFTLVSGAYLRGIMTQVVTKRSSGKKSREGAALHMLEAGIVLGLVNLMFVTFVVMQLGYLFGGAAYIESTSGITLAQYTRKGFFELVTVASLALAVIMCLKRYFKPANAAHETLFRILAGVQIALLLVMLVSAAQRMWMYTASFGLTELRLYTSAFIAWLAFVLVWFVDSALKGQALKFVRGTVFAGSFVIMCLHVLNPEALIARTNINRAVEGAQLDLYYLSTLSSDAMPVIVEQLPALPADERDKVSTMLLDKWLDKPEKDWRSWNFSRYQAVARIQELEMARVTQLHSRAEPGP